MQWLSLAVVLAITVFAVQNDKKNFSAQIKKFEKSNLVKSVICTTVMFILTNPVVYKDMFIFYILVLCFFLCLYLFREIALSAYISSESKKGIKEEDISYSGYCKKTFFLCNDHITAGLGKGKAKFASKLKMTVIPALLLSYMYFIMGVIEPYYSNITEFSYSIDNIIPPMAVISAVSIALFTLLPALANKRICGKIVAAVSFFSLFSYIQCAFLNTDTFIDGTVKANPKSEIIINTAAFIAVMYLSQVIYIKKAKAVVKVSEYISLALLIIQLAPLPYLNNNDYVSNFDYTGYKLVGNGQYELSTDENIIVILADTFSLNDYKAVESAKKEYIDKLSDFICFDNISSETFYTAFSMPVILTAHDNDYTKSLITSNADSWNSYEANTFYDRLHENGYSVRLYTDMDIYCGGAENMRGKIDNVEMYEAHYYVANSFLTYYKIFNLSLYRYLPLGLKLPETVSSSTEFNKYVLSTEERDSVSTDDWEDGSDYAIKSGIAFYNDDYYAGFKSGFVPVNDKKICVFQHLFGMHEPYYSLEPGSSLNNYRYSTEEEAAINCIRMFTEYLDQLKEQGLYDNSTIIFTADHGYHSLNNCSPVMLVKPAERTSDKMVYNSAPGVLQMDMLPTLLDCIGAKYDDIGLSLISMDENAEREREILDFTYISSYPAKRKCVASGTSVYNCYMRYKFNCNIDSIDYDEAYDATYEITDYWW